MVNETICATCAYCRFTPAKIGMDPDDSYDAERDCLNDSPNFMTDDGCYRYEETYMDRN